MSNPYIAAAITRRVAANSARCAESSFIASPSQMQTRNDAAVALRSLWASLIPEGTPDITQFFDWYDRFPTVVERAIRRTADKSRVKRRTPGGVPFTADGVARYASATMRGMSQDTARPIPAIVI